MRKSKDYVHLKEHATPFGTLILEAIQKTRGSDRRLIRLRAVARYAGISASTIERIITGEKKNLETVYIARICTILRIPLDTALHALYPEKEEVTNFFHIWNIYQALPPEKRKLIDDVIVSQVPPGYTKEE